MYKPVLHKHIHLVAPWVYYVHSMEVLILNKTIAIDYNEQMVRVLPKY